MGYTHELYKPKATTFNTVWPKRSDSEHANKLFRAYLKSRRLDFETAYLAGWYLSFMDCDRIVIPCVTTKPGHAYYQARAVESCVNLRYRSPYGARYGALCVVDSLSGPSACIAVVEGPMDALALASCGIDAIAVMGIRPDRETGLHLTKLVKDKYEACAVIFDNEDEAKSCALVVAVGLAAHGIRSTTLHTKSKDFADASDSERNLIVKGIMQWGNPRKLLTNTSD